VKVGLGARVDEIEGVGDEAIVGPQRHDDVARNQGAESPRHSVLRASFTGRRAAPLAYCNAGSPGIDEYHERPDLK
jgi:hypothetical protein